MKKEINLQQTFIEQLLPAKEISTEAKKEIIL